MSIIFNGIDSLEEEILALIDLQTEGGYWDFKEKWHDNKADLLHDIISLANNLDNRDSYLIIGVSDSGDIKGAQNSSNKMNQEQLSSFLKDKKFAGDNRPLVYLKSISYNGDTIDIIIIINTCSTPFYLTTSFDHNGGGKSRRVRSGHIYTRIIDKNTDIDKCADIDKVEYLWKKRFGIDRSPIDKVKFLLQSPKDWLPVGTDGEHSSDISYKQWYNKQNPEFTIVYEVDQNRFNKGRIDNLEADIYWMSKLPQPLHNAYIYNVYVKYHSTVMYSTLAVFADNFRFKRSLWKHFSIENGGNNYIRYSYIEKNSLEFAIDRWLNNHYDTIQETLIAPVVEPTEPQKRYPEYCGRYSPYMVVPIFESENEHMCFVEYLKNNLKTINKKIGKCPDIYYANPDYIDYLCNTGEAVVTMLIDWRNNFREGIL